MNPKDLYAKIWKEKEIIKRQKENQEKTHKIKYWKSTNIYGATNKIYYLTSCRKEEKKYDLIIKANGLGM